MSEQEEQKPAGDLEVAPMTASPSSVSPTPTGSEAVPGRAWYIIHTYAGHEEKVRTALEHLIEANGLQKRILQVMVPTEDVVEIRKNRRSLKKRKFFPGYVLLDMVMDEDTYHGVKDIPGVTGFLGGTTPTPLPADEAEGLLQMVNVPASTKPKLAVMFEKDEQVRIIDGPFANFAGVVEEVNAEKARLRVMVSIFGRSTPVELDFLQVERI